MCRKTASPSPATPNGTAQPGSLYVPEKLEEKDKYSFFLGGNQPLCVIQTQQKDAPKVLIVRDSYSDSLAPFLTQRFSELHLFDLRYNLTSVKSYVAEHDIDAVVVLYSFSNFVTGTNLFVLGTINKKTAALQTERKRSQSCRFLFSLVYN